MKQAMSLEEEKRRLLEQLENSRAVYRRMLTDSDAPVYGEAAPVIYDGYSHAVRYPRSFPQSQTMRWIMRHPYLFAAGAAALVVASKKGLSKSRKKSTQHAAQQPAREVEQDSSSIKKGIAATTLGTSLVTTAAMVLRNPAQMQALMRAVGMAVNYYKSRRRDPRQRFG